MEYIKKSNRKRFQNSQNCTAFEYPFENEKNINGAVIELTGRYPDKGYASNAESTELVYVIEGGGIISHDSIEVLITGGDMLLIKPSEKYYFEGNLKLLISSIPPWSPEQYSNPLT